MSGKTIAHVIDYGAPSGGSFIPALESLSRALTARGDHLAVIATEIPGATWPRELAAAGADVRLVRNERELTEALRALQPQVVHSHFTRFDLSALHADRQARVFWHIHSHRERVSAALKLKAFTKYRLLGARVEALVAVSQAMRDECIAWFAPRERVHVVYNGIDVERFRPPTPEERGAAREQFGISPNDRIVLFFERVPYKGGATVKRTLDLLPQQYRLLVAGGTREDREHFGAPPRVISVERAPDARQLYWAADALAFASNREAFGLVLIEALACGLPIAATDIPVVHEIRDGLESVFLFRVDDARGLADALERAVTCPTVGPGRARVVESFSLGRWTTETLKLYDRA